MRLVLVLYLVGSLVAGAPLVEHLWARGEHPTPEYWVYHELLERLGFARHHGATEQVPLLSQSEGELPATRAVGIPPAALPPGPQLVVAPAAPTFSAGSALHQIVGSFLALAAPEAGQRLTPLRSPVLTGLRPAPPEKPPPFDR